MLRMAATRFLYLILIGLVTTGLYMTLTSCEHASPTLPCDCDEEEKPIDSSTGLVADSVKTETKLFNDPETGEWTSQINFLDSGDDVIGTTEITAGQDLVAFVSLQQYNIPGESYIQLNNYFTMKVVVTLSPTNPTKYQVLLTNMDSGETVSFLINNLGSLGKTSASQSIQGAANIDPTIFSCNVATHAAMLCIGAAELVETAQACREYARIMCGALGVRSAFVEARFSLRYGCQSSCSVTCNVHDQGGIGS